MPRSRRLALVAQLLSGRRFSSQEELAKALAKAGVHVTQATLSRDLRSLGVGKRPDANGHAVYELPTPATETLDRDRQLLDLRAFVNEVKVAQNLSVVRTPPGHANGVARAIDHAGVEGIVGALTVQRRERDHRLLAHVVPALGVVIPHHQAEVGRQA